MLQYLFRIMRTFQTCNHPFLRHFHGNPSTSKCSHYEILGVKTNATTSEIQDAFVKLSKKYHPDVNKNDKNAHDRFVEINEAYSVLSKADTRRDYDAKLRQGWTSDMPPPPRDSTREMYRRYYEQLHREQQAHRGFLGFHEMIRPQPTTYGYENIDDHLGRYQNVVIVDRPDEETERSSTRNHNRIVEA